MLRRFQTLKTIVTDLLLSLPIRHEKLVCPYTLSKEASSWCSEVKFP